MTSFTITCQTLKPIVFLHDKDTLFGFNIEQSKYIAITHSNYVYCDSISAEQAKVIQLQDSAFKAQRSQLNALRGMVDNTNSMYNNEVALNSALTKDIKAVQKGLRRQRLYKKVAFGLGILIGGSAIYLANQ